MVTGHIAFETVTSFFSDFHHEDREDVDVEAVFLHPEEAVPQSQDPDAEDDSSIMLVSMFAMKADLSSPEMKQWQNEYLQGTGCEMYTETLSSSFVRLTYSQTAETCFVRLKLLIIAIETINEEGKPEIAIVVPASNSNCPFHPANGPSPESYPPPSSHSWTRTLGLAAVMTRSRKLSSAWLADKR